MSERATTATERGPGQAAFPWVQVGALVLGALLMIYGLVGFWPAFAPPGPDGRQPTLLGLEINPLRSALQLALGVAGMLCATRFSAARAYGWVLAVVSLAFVVFGILGILDRDVDWLGMNVPSTVVAGVFAALGLVLALGPVRRSYPGGARPPVHAEPGPRDDR
ncbi:hypothetical protein GCM10010472_36760 [Pseudonocardia halophobica]|uniref:DUF4383 domain-containing protein n=1 Tax=Pseudonocardia halophobica TaxID=29401 RepID=A0A9W6P157_9PSEU|nr:DUF4383 domain-containing protein [Pseudonocardia halophobica]GLL15901.1 hypothetical protein GCM10017577_70550 [Pseudonocardia halophobica]